ncbi:IS200/IS605 family transposase [Sporomusa malonica]|uniref:Putative transposase n=1 Tax=Sporomusa malonica TaxID=112901 RepID=A0A1W2A472_9FIRM|nr:IS200/IS605 family transposase [Sporomusa malonica]SMC55477.1 putative transposase [Sporomusa malonica]
MKMPYIYHNHSVCLLAYHFVTCTKKRKPELEGISLDLFKQAVSKYPLTIHVGEVMPDHIHLLIQAPTTFSPAYIAKIIKGCSSRAIGKIRKDNWNGWSTGYFVTSTGGVATDTVKAYIENQKND